MKRLETINKIELTKKNIHTRINKNIPVVLEAGGTSLATSISMSMVESLAAVSLPEIPITVTVWRFDIILSRIGMWCISVQNF